MRLSPPSLAATSLVYASLATAQLSLVGTWSSKSRSVITGPGFYNPVDDRLIEPALTGISYSFTADGYYEEAYYRAVANPSNPNCISGVMQWQHGTYTLPSNGSIVLIPIAVDGRQLTSTPCTYDNSLYERYSQYELIKEYSLEIDKFHNVPRLNLFLFDGSPQQPLYQVYNPPMMLPTQTLNPTATTATPTAKAKRGLDGQVPIQIDEPSPRRKDESFVDMIDENMVWWAGLGMIAVGSAMAFYPTSK